AGLSFVPAVGWNLQDGLLTSQQTVSGVEEVIHLGASLENGGVRLNVKTGPFTGTPDELLKNIHTLNASFKSIDNDKFSSDPITATTNLGAVGVAQSFVGVNVEGVLVAFVIDGIGIEFVVTAAPGVLADNSDAVSNMISSLAYEKPETQP
ncbi:MAG: hypothetical protein ACRDHN_01105, partial [Thermomicrobiales bacterium]